MAAKKTAAAKTAAPAKRTTRKKKVAAPTPEQIAERAYYLHLERGGEELENWLTAERELAPA